MELNLISSDLKKDLILSVGQHSGRRPLSPVEVATGLELLKSYGMNNMEISQLLLLRDTTMIGRFQKLLKLIPSIRHIVDWGTTGVTLSFSSAVEISRLESVEQNAVATMTLRNSLTKDEIIQIVQIRKRSGRDIGSCISEVVNMRPKFEKKYVLIASVFDEDLQNILSSMNQYDRDSLLKKSLDANIFSEVNWEGKLGADKITLVGEEDFNNIMVELKPDFESVINKWLLDEVNNG